MLSVAGLDILSMSPVEVERGSENWFEECLLSSLAPEGSPIKNDGLLLPRQAKLRSKVSVRSETAPTAWTCPATTDCNGLLAPSIKNISAFLHRNTNSLYLWLWNNKLGEIINSHSYGVFCSFFVSVFQFWLVTSFPKYKLDVKNVQIFFNFNFNVWVWATRKFQHGTTNNVYTLTAIDKKGISFVCLT